MPSMQDALVLALAAGIQPTRQPARQPAPQPAPQPIPQPAPAIRPKRARPAGPRRVPVATFDGGRLAVNTGGTFNRPDPSTPRAVVEPNYAERYFTKEFKK